MIIKSFINEYMGVIFIGSPCTNSNVINLFVDWSLLYVNHWRVRVTVMVFIPLSKMFQFI